MANLENPNIQHFNGSGAAAPGTLVSFSRPVKRLYISTTVTTLLISFDGGETTYALPAGHLEIIVPPLISFRMQGAGAFNALGMAE